MEVTNMKKNPVRVYLFADLICIYFTTLGCREEKNGKKKEHKKCQPVLLTPQNSPQSFLPFTTSQRPTVGKPHGKGGYGGCQSEDIQVSTWPTSFRHHNLLRVSASNQSYLLMRKCREKPALWVIHSTCPPKGWRQSPSMQQLSWT